MRQCVALFKVEMQSVKPANNPKSAAHVRRFPMSMVSDFRSFFSKTRKETQQRKQVVSAKVVAKLPRVTLNHIFPLIVLAEIVVSQL